jgi:outer membrane lipoprotein-sorting protein
MYMTYPLFRMSMVAILLVCKTLLVFSQDVNVDLERMKTTYASYKSISYDATYTSYMNDLSSHAIDIAHGSMVHQGNDKYQKIGNIEIVSNLQYTLTVDHDDHEMYYSKGGMATDEKNVQMDVEQLLQFCTVEKKDVINESRSAITLIPKKKSDDFERVRIVYNNKTYLVQEMQLHYTKSTTYVVKGKAMKGKPILVVNFENYKVNQKINTQLFTYQKFIRKENEQLFVKSAFKNYSINGAQVVSLKNN